MSMFVVANLGDAVVNLPTGSVNAGGTVSSGGFLFVNNTTAAPMLLTLNPDLTPFLLIVDIAGNAGTYTITVASTAGINGASTFSINVNNQWVWLVWNGTSYTIIG